MYRRIISAALADTKSRFRMAEALALDIPPKRRGPTAHNEQSVVQQIEGARQAIIDAGGEPRTVATLGDHRLTALWVGDGDTFRWLKGVSFTAHNLARGGGLSYPQFAALSDGERSIEALRGKPSREQLDGQLHPQLDGHGQLDGQLDGHSDGGHASPWTRAAHTLEEFAHDLDELMGETDGPPPGKQRPRLTDGVHAAEAAMEPLRTQLGMQAAVG